MQGVISFARFRAAPCGLILGNGPAGQDRDDHSDGHDQNEDYNHIHRLNPGRGW